MRKTYLLSLFLLLIINHQSLAFSTEHNHDIPNNFRVSCTSYGPQKKYGRSDIVWDASAKKMIITGEILVGDNDKLVEGRGAISTRSIKYATETFKGLAIPGFNNVSASKKLYMTFRDDYDSRPTIDNGEGWSYIRTFMFHILDDALGGVLATDASSFGGILVVSNHVILEDCTYTGIYAKP